MAERWRTFLQIATANPVDTASETVYDLTASQPMDVESEYGLRKTPHGRDLQDLTEGEKDWVKEGQEI
eukprot:3996935-Alexandrium_andersonii.AAC.1